MNKDERLLTSFGERIKTLREAKEWSQTDLAFNINTSASYISRLENGRVEPGLLMIYKLAEALSQSPADLLI